MKNKKGFTLIELLAVIIILGVLMLVAIPSVTAYINNSRKEAYINTAKQYIKGATNLVNSGNLDVFDPTVTYYIPSSCVPLETGGESPYGGKFNPAYVLVTYDNNSYNYYWMSRDDQGIGIKSPTSSIKIEAKNIESGIKTDDVTPTVGIDGRGKIIVFSTDCSTSSEPSPAEDIIAGEEGKEDALTYPEGKNRGTVEIGNIVKIGDEEFYVTKRDDNNLYLLARYNLKVGNIVAPKAYTISGAYSPEDEGYGRQSSEAKGHINGADYYYGTVPFSSTNYWVEKVGSVYPGIYCSSSSGTNCAYVYDSNSNLYQYIVAYKTYLESLGATIKEARIMSLEESQAFQFAKHDLWRETSFWLGSAHEETEVFHVYTNGAYFSSRRHDNNNTFGVRPYIIV